MMSSRLPIGVPTTKKHLGPRALRFLPCQRQLCESCASSSGPVFEMSPAPSVMTMSPGKTKRDSSLASLFRSGMWWTDWWPWARILSTRIAPPVRQRRFANGINVDDHHFVSVVEGACELIQRSRVRVYLCG